MGVAVGVATGSVSSEAGIDASTTGAADGDASKLGGGGASAAASKRGGLGEPEKPLVAPGTTWVFPDDAASSLAEGRVPMAPFNETDGDRDDGDDDDAGEQSMDDVSCAHV